MIQNTPLVNIIVPIYNLEGYISDCLNSLISQTYTNIEIILVNDGSTDNSKNICEEFCKLDNRIILLNHTSNLGVVTSRNDGIRVAKGEYIVFVDGDDWVESNMVECFVNNIGDTDLVCCGYYNEKTNSKFYNKDMIGIKDINEVLNIAISASVDTKPIIYSFMWGKFFKTKLVKEIFNSLDKEITFSEDFVFVYKYLLLCKKINFIPDCLYNYRFRKGSAVNSNNKQSLTILNKIYLSLEKDFINHPMKDILISQLQSWIIRRVKWALNDGLEFKEHIQAYVVNTYGLDDKKIVLFGAGNVGEDAFSQFSKFGYNVVMWVDSNKRQCNNQIIYSPNEILNIDYDVIYLAVKNELMAEGMKEQLINMGIKEDKIIWNAPIKIL